MRNTSQSLDALCEILLTIYIWCGFLLHSQHEEHEWSCLDKYKPAGVVQNTGPSPWLVVYVTVIWTNRCARAIQLIHLISPLPTPHQNPSLAISLFPPLSLVFIFSYLVLTNETFRFISSTKIFIAFVIKWALLNFYSMQSNQSYTLFQYFRPVVLFKVFWLLT